jgi:DNA-binding MarR family transcriptional regulator
MLNGDYHDCNASQRDVLYLLRMHGRMSGGELARESDYSSGAISYALRALDERGLVERKVDGYVQGRPTYNTLTDKGRSVTTQAFNQYREAL